MLRLWLTMQTSLQKGKITQRKGKRERARASSQRKPKAIQSQNIKKQQHSGGKKKSENICFVEILAA